VKLPNLVEAVAALEDAPRRLIEIGLLFFFVDNASILTFERLLGERRQHRVSVEAACLYSVGRYLRHVE